MILKSLKVQRYRSLFDVDINIEKLNIIVGSNDSGKSNVLRAINMFLQPNIEFKGIDYSVFPDLGGMGDVKANPIVIDGRFTMNGDDLASFRKVHADFNHLNAITRTNDAYNINYGYLDYQNRQAHRIQPVAPADIAFLPKVVNIDLSDAYSSLEGGGFGDLVKEIEDSFGALENRESQNHFKTSLNRLIKEYWNSDKRSNITISTYNDDIDIDCSDAYSVSTALGQRGTGFQAFIYMALQLMNATNSANNNRKDLVVLIEEPERMLHPQGQDDFVKLLRKFLADNPNMIAFITTHSPTIVRADKMANILLVEKNNEGKSVVNGKPHRNNWKALRNSLGMRPSDSLLIGDISIIVEGACEQMFLPFLMQKYCDIDVSVLNFVSAEGVENISYYAQMLKDMNTDVLAIFDNDAIGRRRRDDLIKCGLVDDAKIFMYESEDEKEIAFEDLFPNDKLFEAAIKRYKSELDSKEHNITIDDFTKYCEENKIPNYVKKCWATKMAEYLKSLGIIEHKKDLDKFAICKYFIDGIDECPEQIELLSQKFKEVIHGIL